MLALWLVLGLGYSAAQTPSGRLLRRSAHAEDRPAVFAAQFALSHACWLICYPLAGQMGAQHLQYGRAVAFSRRRDQGAREAVRRRLYRIHRLHAEGDSPWDAL